MFRNTLCASAVFVFLLLFSIPAFAADISLPQPQQEGGMGLFEALRKRSSMQGGDFSPMGEVSEQELSNILWATTGLNRGSKGWTVPMAKGAEPYCKVYVAGNKGVFLYDWSSHSLRQVSSENIKGRIGQQNFVKNAAYSIIIVGDSDALAAYSEDLRVEYQDVLVGAMSQNMYLAAAAMKIGTRYIHSIHKDEISKALSLHPGDDPVCVMMLGR